jgi:hypothetical protein
MRVRHVSGNGRKALEVALQTLGNKVGKVGWFEGAKYPDGTQVAYVATIQEYGYSPKNIPPRPFMRPTIVKYRNTWDRIAKAESKLILEGKSTPSKMMEAIGQNAAGNIRKKITQIYTPSLKFSTIQARLSRRGLGAKGRPYTKTEIGNLYKPLVDTGHMLATLINVVEDK